MKSTLYTFVSSFTTTPTPTKLTHKFRRVILFMIPIFFLISLFTLVSNLSKTSFTSRAFHYDRLVFKQTQVMQRTRSSIFKRANQTSSSGQCDISKDPLPSGGAKCDSDIECNSLDKGGVCDPKSQTCFCTAAFGRPNCSYKRQNKDLAGGLQLGLLYIGVNGVGNIIIGRLGAGISQLIMWVIGLILVCAGGCMLCCCGGGDLVGFVVIIFGGVICGALLLASFIWSIVDGAFILQCKYSDALGYALF